MNGFIKYMFDGSPWYTGAFWSNQVQWTLVMLPSLLVILYRQEVHHREHMRELRKQRGK
jgi:hypothetical protein